MSWLSEEAVYNLIYTRVQAILSGPNGRYGDSQTYFQFISLTAPFAPQGYAMR